MERIENNDMTIEKKHLLNYSILVPYLILSVVGLVIVYSATSANQVYAGKNPFRPVLMQGAFWAVSLVAIWFIYRLRLDFLEKSQLLFAATLAELVLLVATLFATSRNGASGWLELGPFISLQAAEYLKLLVVWLLAFIFARRQKAIAAYDYLALTRGTILPRRLRDWRLYLGVLVLLVVVQPDLGNATIIVLTAIIMYALSGIAYRWFSALLGVITVSSTLFLGFIGLVGVDTVANVPLFGHVAKRFSAFFNPFKDLTDSGHQLAHSYYAMSNGGWFGRGLGHSIEKNGYLPEAQSDFVFAIVIEELGLIGAGLILALVFFLILRILLVGLKAKKNFNAMLALGIGTMLLTQVFVNIGGISGLIPSTGVTFPFLSQGGNSLLTISVAIGIVLNIDANEKRAAIFQEWQSNH